MDMLSSTIIWDPFVVKDVCLFGSLIKMNKSINFRYQDDVIASSASSCYALGDLAMPVIIYVISTSKLLFNLDY